MARSFTHNPGYVSLPNIPDDKIIAGVVVVMKDDAGEFSSEWHPESLDALPAPEVRETLGGFTATAFELANLGVGQ